MNVFIIYAHPEPQSFNGAMRDLAVEVLTEAGHEVKVSDLCAMKFNPVVSRADFTTVGNPTLFRVQSEQVHAHENHGFAPDIAAEMEKLLWARAVIFQFPLWWVGLPAILKGWVDRVLAMGFAYGGGHWFDTGPLRGRRAMCALTTGGPETMYSARGLQGAIRANLHPINNGILHFVGMDVLPPFIAWSAARVGPDVRKRYLAEYRERLLALETTPPIAYQPVAAYDTDLQLKPGLEPMS
jgi:NAD(P)H dehydrogenase (quinone)